MRLHAAILLALLLPLGACDAPSPKAGQQAEASTENASKWGYPNAKTVAQVDEYFGVKVEDPYRWMENLDDPELATWVAGQNNLVQSYLEDAPSRYWIKQRLSALWNFERYGLPDVAAGRYFFKQNTGLQNQSPIFVQDGLDGTPRLLLDPNELSADGTIALSETSPSPDGKLFGYSTSDGGSDWRTIRVRDVESGKDLDDVIEWAKFTGITWAKDNSGFFYAGYDKPEGEDELKAVNQFQKLWFHKLGTQQKDDQLVFERKDQPEWGFSAAVSDDGRLLIISGSQGTDERNRLWVKDLSKADAPIETVFENLEATWEFVGNRDRTIFLRTDDQASQYRLIALDLDQPAREHWREVIPSGGGGVGTLQEVSHLNNQFIASYLVDARSAVTVYDEQGKKVRDIDLPGLGATDGFRGSVNDTEAFFSYSSFAVPDTMYRYDATTGQVSAFKTPKVDFDPGKFETIQVKATSAKDGTAVPMFITMKKGLALDGNNPTILYGYGGFNIPNTPRFSPANIAWMEMGGIYASANLRGGGEYGPAWHEQGTKTQKQNVFDDAAGAAQFLIAQKYTSADKLALSGRSNGGLLAAATVLKYPDLFRASLPAVGVLDMLRFRDFTIGWAWESDYGSVKNEDEFKALYAYSPLHNIKPNTRYPALLVTTADRDDRVFPAHSLKFTAAMQAANPNAERPTLIRVETRAGHGAGKPTIKQIEEAADIFAFLSKELDMADLDDSDEDEE